MTRVLWSIAATLILVAVGAPCLTFYMLIKEYWSEIDALRQELLLCQLGSKDPFRKNGFTGHSSFVGEEVNNPVMKDIYPSIPLPQRLTSSQPDGALNFVSPVTERSVYDESMTSQKSMTSQSSSLRAGEDSYSLRSQVQSDVTSPSFQNSSLNNRMISDDKSQETSNNKTIILSEDYVKKLERRAADLVARVDACRKCLDPAQQKESKCGGGASWREFRRKEKLARRKIRKEKKKRKNNRKINKDGRMEDENGNNVPTEAPFSLLADTTRISEYRPVNFRSQNNHQMRENHRASTDFRRGFNQKIVRMDEALMQFSETQSTFCKELRDNLGGRLEKRGQELAALSEQIAALVRTTTAQVATIEKLTSDQVQTGQNSIEKNLANLQVLREDQVRSFQDFHKKVFLPAMVTLTSLLGEQASAVTNMGVDLITKVEMLQDFFLTYSTKQGDTLKKLAEEVDMFASKHGNLLMRSRDHARHLHLNTENFIRELQTRMNNVVKELVLVRLQSQSFISLNENTYHEISSSLNTTEDVVARLSEDLQRRVDMAKTDEGDFRNSFRQETDLINARVETGVSEALMRNHAAMSQIGETELDTRAFASRGETAWNEMYENQETELRQEADMLANKLRSQTHHTQNILAGLRGTASTHEQVLEQQRMDFQGFVRKRQDALDSQCSSISDWALLMSSELRHRDEDLHRFLSEDRLSPATVTGVTELTSRFPDGSVIYDPSPSSDNFPPQEESRSITTSLSAEVVPEDKTLESTLNSTDARNLLPLFTFQLPNQSSRTNSSVPVVQETSNTSLMEEIGEEAHEELEGPIRGDLNGIKSKDLSQPTDEVLSNDIKVNNDVDFDNRITHQSDQAFLGSGCNVRRRGKDASQTKDGDDGLEALERIVLEAKRTVLKFQKEFQEKGKKPKEKVLDFSSENVQN